MGNDAEFFFMEDVDIPGMMKKCAKGADRLVDKGGKWHLVNREPLCVHSVGNEAGEHSWWYLSFLRALSTRRVYLTTSCLNSLPDIATSLSRIKKHPCL